MTRTLPSIFAAALLLGAPLASPARAEARPCAEPPWGYRFEDWAGPALDVACYVPRRAKADAPILIVVPGASRDVQRFHASWLAFAHRRGFAVLTLGAPRERFPDEYAYNAGGAVAADGRLRPRERRLFAALDPVFEDFRARFGFSTERYHLFGHSAGGGFVHRFALFEPDAKLLRAVAANPAFATLPDFDVAYPFGLGGTGLDRARLARWFSAPLTILLGERDLSPRTQPLSDGPLARAQGPHVLARGRLLFERARAEAKALGVPFRWQLVVAEGVGHDNRAIAPFALEALFGAPR